ncbi:winged helix-turn-helix transcriptional regulator [Candidatus Gottesmanbacteria bacterium]|nr:winged helix-turn-helix transcriptional regulator [Candidatus Gottesmanbacteria bacterium]
MADDQFQQGSIIGQVQDKLADSQLANTSDPTWPISTKMANEAPKEASTSGQSVETPLANNSSAHPDLTNQTATDSGHVAPPSIEPKPTEITSSSNLANPSSSDDSDSPISPPLPQSPSSPNDISTPPVSVTTTPIAPSQVQSGPSDSASINTTFQVPPDLANIKTEPPKPVQNAPLANGNSQKTEEIKPPTSPKSSFGEILAKENPPSSSNPPISSAPSILPKPSSFGDILHGNTSPSQLDQSLQDEPKINIEPIVPPKPSPAVTPQIPPSPPLPQSPLAAEASAKEGISSLRQKANAKRLNKRQKNLDKIMLFIKETGTITNTDVQRLCRVSQSTATNYLTELEKKGLLKQQGIRGGAKYTL